MKRTANVEKTEQLDDIADSFSIPHRFYPLADWLVLHAIRVNL